MHRMQANVLQNRGRWADELMNHEPERVANNLQLASRFIRTVARRAPYSVPGALRSGCFCTRGAMFWYADLVGLRSKQVAVC